MLSQFLLLSTLLGQLSGHALGTTDCDLQQRSEDRAVIRSCAPGTVSSIGFDNLQPSYASREVALTATLPSGFSLLDLKADGGDIQNVSLDGNVLQLTVYLGAADFSLSVAASDGSEEQISKTIYFSKGRGKWYSSSFSAAEAKVACLDEALSEGIISESEYLEQSSAARLSTAENIIDLGPIIPPPPISLYDYFYPHLSWTDSAGNEQPLAYVTVELYKIVDGSKTALDTSTTDENGEATLKVLSASAADADSFGIKVLAKNESVDVFLGNEESYDGTYSFAIDNVVDGRSMELTLPPDSEANKIFQIFEIGAYCSLFGRSVVGGVNLSRLYIACSGGDAPPFLTEFDDNTPVIVVNPSFFANSTSIFTYEDWDTIAHEYGHFLSFELGWADQDIPSSEHTNYDNMIDVFDDPKLGNAPEDGLRFAWAEGLATYLGQAALRYNSQTLETVPLANDRSYTTANGFSYSFDGYGYVQSNGIVIVPKGAGNEYAVSQLLYKMADDHTDQYDGLGIGDGALISMLDHLGASKTAGSFVDVALDTLDDDDAFALGKLLERLDFSPKNLTVSFLFGRPAFSWEGTGGSATHPFVSFHLTVYDEDLRPIYAISSHDSYSWSPSSSTWGTIVGDAGGGPIYLRVAGRTDLEYRHFPSSLLEVDTQ